MVESHTQLTQNVNWKIAAISRYKKRAMHINLPPKSALVISICILWDCNTACCK